MSHHRSRRLVYTVAAALALFTALTGMASASVPGLERVSASSLNDSLPGKDRFAGCPTGKKLLGLGGEMTGAFGQAVLDNMTPNAALTGASISAREVQGGSVNNWKVKGYAICATA
jgi:hypothetical protein